MNLRKIFSILFIIISVTSLVQWFRIDVYILTFSTLFMINISVLGCLIWYISIYKGQLFSSKSIPIILYGILMIIGVIRGAFVAENYWEWKQWLFVSQTLFLPFFGLAYSRIDLSQYSIKLWIKYSLPFFLVAAAILIRSSTYGYYLSPVLLIGIFYPVLKTRWKLITIILLVVVLATIFTARSSGLKSMAILLIIFSYSLRVLHKKWIFNSGIALFFLGPIVLLFLGISGVFNVFSITTLISEDTRNEVLADTRSFIYEEQIASALNNNYIFFGRTPARGFDSVFGEIIAEQMRESGNSSESSIKNERPASEVLFLNIFNYLGLSGVILYSLIYFQASFLAVNRSKNIFAKMLGLYIAFRWAYGWVEDFNRLDIMNLTLWMSIGLCISNEFRGMTNKDVEKWLDAIFTNSQISGYINFNLKNEIKSNSSITNVL